MQLRNMKELWIGMVEVLTDPSTGDGDTRAYTNVVTWAESVSGYRDAVAHAFSEYEWAVLDVENARPIASETGFSEEISEMIERASANQNACIYATFHYYPSKPM
jgi:hypothetical protein